MIPQAAHLNHSSHEFGIVTIEILQMIKSHITEISQSDNSINLILFFLNRTELINRKFHGDYAEFAYTSDQLQIQQVHSQDIHQRKFIRIPFS